MIPTGIIAITSEPSLETWQAMGGPALKQAAAAIGCLVRAEALVPATAQAIALNVRDFAAHGCRLILITGGCGLGPQDITPEAVRAIARCELPWFGETLRRHSSAADRSLAAIVGNALVLVLPADSSAALAVLAPGIPAFLAEVV
jgi:molybdopterin biosynthesis enzyme MoaB